jgi:ankyrin repeat protein
MDNVSTRIFKITLIVIFVAFSKNLYSQVQERDTSKYLYLLVGPDVQLNLNYALMKAAADENIPGIKWLMNHGAEIDAVTPEQVTPLLFAVAKKNKEAVKALLEYEPDVNHYSRFGETPLLLAVKNNDIVIAEMLIRDSADINLSDQNGATPLHFAAIYGFFYLADMLLYYEAANFKETFDGTTPLMAAVYSGSADIADLLLQNGANPEARDKMGFTPFLIAAQNGDTLIMDLLLKRKIDLYEINNFKINALDICIKMNFKEAAIYLLRKGDKWLTSKPDAINPYSVATVFRRKEIAGILRENNIPENYRFGFNQISFSASTRVCLHDYFAGISFSLKEPSMNAGLFVGCDVKPDYTRVLIKKNSNLFYQYMDKSSLAYAGVFKDFSLTDYPLNANWSFTCSLAAAYAFGNKLKGTEIVPENKFKIVPGLGFKIAKNSLCLSGNIDYIKSGFYKVGPIWFRLGVSYSFFFDNLSAPAKIIKWY